MSELVDRPAGPRIAPAELPEWLRQFDLFLDVRRFPNGELLLECLFCDLALAVPLDFAPRDNPQTVLKLAGHGMGHAADGKVRR